MKLLQFYHLLDSNKTVQVGVLIRESTVIPLNVQGNMRDYICNLASSVIDRKDIEQQIEHTKVIYKLDEVKLLSPLTNFVSRLGGIRYELEW
jgi:hypothetical protein